MHKTKPSPWAPEWGDDSCRSRALHEVRCPRPSRAGCRGVGRASDRWMARSPSPHYGGYTTHAVESAEPPSRSDCCCCCCCCCCCWIVLFLNNNYWCGCCPGRGRFVWTVLHSYQNRRFRLDETSGCRIEPFGAAPGRAPTTAQNVLEVIRFPVQPPPLLIVSEHARGFWLASAEDSGYQNIARQLVLSHKLALIRLEVSIGTGKWRFRIGRPHFSCLC